MMDYLHVKNECKSLRGVDWKGRECGFGFLRWLGDCLRGLINVGFSIIGSCRLSLFIN